jgi:DNA-binding MarR family transcriptional regulator
MPTPRLDEPPGCACLQLRKVTRQVTRMYDRALEPAGLTTAQFSALSFVGRTADPSVGDIAARLVMDQTTATRLLKPLLRDRLIELAAAKDDKRRRAVRLTPKGRRKYEEALPLWRGAQAGLGQALGAKQLRALWDTLESSLERIAGR